jgi:sterol desaturase/sphingolipid hydroxylase (fatty acid hydroxylase superfamily)
MTEFILKHRNLKQTGIMLRYWFDFILFPLVAATIIAFDCRSLQWLAWCAFGVLLFTFVEYWAHRLILHRILWHGKHERHHTHPSEYVTFPIWYVPSIFAGFFIVMPLPVFAGFVIGYIWFLFWHHALHHWQLEHHPWVRAYADWHAVHHADLPYNYGITHPAFDWLFGTYVTTAQARAARKVNR